MLGCIQCADDRSGTFDDDDRANLKEDRRIRLYYALIFVKGKFRRGSLDSPVECKSSAW